MVLRRSILRTGTPLPFYLSPLWFPITFHFCSFVFVACSFSCLYSLLSSFDLFSLSTCSPTSTRHLRFPRIHLLEEIVGFPLVPIYRFIPFNSQTRTWHSTIFRLVFLFQSATFSKLLLFP